MFLFGFHMLFLLFLYGVFLSFRFFSCGFYFFYKRLYSVYMFLYGFCVSLILRPDVDSDFVIVFLRANFFGRCSATLVIDVRCRGCLHDQAEAFNYQSSFCVCKKFTGVVFLCLCLWVVQARGRFLIRFQQCDPQCCLGDHSLHFGCNGLLCMCCCKHIQTV